MNDDDRPLRAGRGGALGAQSHGNPNTDTMSPTRGALVRLGDDLDRVAIDVVERIGPRRAGELAAHLVALAGEVTR